MPLEIRIVDVFHIPGRDTVLAGKVQEGEVTIGQKVEVKAPNESISAVVAGVEVEKQFVQSASRGMSVGLLVESFDPESLPSGFTKTEPSVYELTGVTVVSSARQWWKFW